MNRYTQIATTQFAPRSLEELSIVPAAFRQKHDQAANQLEQTRSQLNAFVDASPQHSEYARSLIQGMNSQIDKMSNDLATSGYNNLTGMNVLKMNRDYQSLVSPTGELGRINAAKKDMAEKYKTFREEGLKAGQDGVDIDRNWAQHVQNYYGFDENGRVANIGQISAPKKVEVIDALKDIKSLLGETQRRIDQAGGGSISIRPDGSLQVVNKSGSIQNITNIPQLKQAQDYIQSRFLLPSGDGFKSAQFQGKSMTDVFNEINNGIRMMTVDKVVDNRNYNTSIQGYINPMKDKLEGGSLGDGLVATGSTFNSANITGVSTIGEAKARLAQLNQSSNLSGAGMQEKRVLMNMIQNSEDRLKGDSEYQKAKADYDKRAKQIGAPKYGDKQSLADIKKSAYLRNEDDPKLMAYMAGKAISSGDGSADKELQKLRNKMKTIENNSFNVDNYRSENYAMVKSGNTKANKMIEDMNNSIGPILKSSNFGLGNNFDLLSVSANGVERSGKKLDQIDKEKIQGLIRNMKPSDISVVGYEHRGSSSLPEYTIALDTRKGQTVSLDRLFRSEKGDMDGIGDGNQILIKVNANTLSNSEGVRTFNKLAADYFRTVGGSKGANIANSIERNVYKNNIANEAIQKQVKWGEFTNPNVFNYTDPTTGTVQENTAFKQIVTEQAIIGVKNQTGITDDVWNRLPAKDQTKLINSYIESNKNKDLIIW